MQSNVELIEYIERRMRLAGGTLISTQNPYNLEIDRIERACLDEGRQLINFANYDYLGMAKEEAISDAACQAIRAFGPGVGASRLVGGERSLHRDFEKEMATFVGAEDAICTVSGYGLNVSLIGHLLGSSDLLLVDEMSHNSIMTGAELTRSTKMTFKHNDLDHLEYLIGRYRNKHKRVLIVVEGLYSMDGDLPDLPRLIEIKKRASAWLMIDEAHSIGVLGAHGKGITEHFDVSVSDVEFIIGTLSKAFASCGGFVCSNAPAIHWLRHTLPGFVYSVGVPPPVVAASREALKILNSEPERVSSLRINSRHALEAAAARGLRTGAAYGAGIIPILVSSGENAVKAFFALLAKDILIPPIIQQAVSNDASRLRMFISSRHSLDLIDKAMDAVCEILEALGEPIVDTSKVTALAAARKARRV